VRHVAGSVGAKDVVIADAAAYYAVRPKAAKTFTIEYPFTDDQLRNVNVLVIRPDQFAAFAKRAGGNWQAGAKTEPPGRHLLFSTRGFGDKLSDVYDLQLFRRMQDGE